MNVSPPVSMGNRHGLLVLALAVLAACGSGTPTPEEGTTVADTVRTEGLPKDGLQRVPLQDGGYMQGMMYSGQRTGAWISFYANGETRSKANYSEGVEVGPTEVYHPNGKTYYTGQYVNGLPFGEWVFFDTDGKVVKTATYDSTGVVIQQQDR